MISATLESPGLVVGALLRVKGGVMADRGQKVRLYARAPKVRRKRKPSTNQRVLAELVALGRLTTEYEAAKATYEREAIRIGHHLRAAGASPEQIANALHLSVQQAQRFMSRADGYRAAEMLGEQGEGAVEAAESGSPLAYLQLGQAR